MNPSHETIWSFAVLGVLVIGLALGLKAFANWREKKRREALETLAGEMGFSFDGERSPFSPEESAQLPFFRLGRSQRLRNVLRGKAGLMNVFLFDYTYVTGSGKSRRTHNQTVASFQRGDRPLPSFSLAPETWFHKIGQLLGFHDLNFDTHPTFSKRWLLRGQDEANVRRLFASHVLDFFAELEGSAQWRLEGSGRWLLVWRDGKRIAPVEMRTFLESASSMSAQFKS